MQLLRRDLLREQEAEAAKTQQNRRSTLGADDATPSGEENEAAKSEQHRGRSWLGADDAVPLQEEFAAGKLTRSRMPGADLYLRRWMAAAPEEPSRSSEASQADDKSSLDYPLYNLIRTKFMDLLDVQDITAEEHDRYRQDGGGTELLPIFSEHTIHGGDPNKPRRMRVTCWRRFSRMQGGEGGTVLHQCILRVRRDPTPCLPLCKSLQRPAQGRKLTTSCFFPQPEL